MSNPVSKSKNATMFLKLVEHLTNCTNFKKLTPNLEPVSIGMNISCNCGDSFYLPITNDDIKNEIIKFCDGANLMSNQIRTNAVDKNSMSEDIMEPIFGIYLQ